MQTLDEWNGNLSSLNKVLPELRLIAAKRLTLNQMSNHQISARNATTVLDNLQRVLFWLKEKDHENYINHVLMLLVNEGGVIDEFDDFLSLLDMLPTGYSAQVISENPTEVEKTEVSHRTKLLIIAKENRFEICHCLNNGKYAQEEVSDEVLINRLRLYNSGDIIHKSSDLIKIKAYLKSKEIKRLPLSRYQLWIANNHHLFSHDFFTIKHFKKIDFFHTVTHKPIAILRFISHFKLESLLLHINNPEEQLYLIANMSWSDLPEIWQGHSEPHHYLIQLKTFISLAFSRLNIGFLQELNEDWSDNDWSEFLIAFAQRTEQICITHDIDPYLPLSFIANLSKLTSTLQHMRDSFLTKETVDEPLTSSNSINLDQEICHQETTTVDLTQASQLAYMKKSYSDLSSSCSKKQNVINISEPIEVCTKLGLLKRKITFKNYLDEKKQDKQIPLYQLMDILIAIQLFNDRHPNNTTQNCIDLKHTLEKGLNLYSITEAGEQKKLGMRRRYIMVWFQKKIDSCLLGNTIDPIDTTVDDNPFVSIGSSVSLTFLPPLKTTRRSFLDLTDVDQGLAFSQTILDANPNFVRVF